MVLARASSMRGFGTQWCAWHSSTTSSYGNIAHTNLPYITDAGASCGANFNGLGANAGITIVEVMSWLKRRPTSFRAPGGRKQAARRTTTNARGSARGREHRPISPLTWAFSLCIPCGAMRLTVARAAACCRTHNLTKLIAGPPPCARKYAGEVWHDPQTRSGGIGRFRCGQVFCPVELKLPTQGLRHSHAEGSI